MRLSADHTGTVDELLLIEAARFLLQQTDHVKNLQEDLDALAVKYSRATHRRALISDDDYEPFMWSCSPLAKLIEDTTHLR